MTFFLRFPDEQTAIDAMPNFRGKDEDGNDIWLTSSRDHALDIIGEIVRESGTVEGWHCNLAGVVPPDAERFMVEPTNPVRMFF